MEPNSEVVSFIQACVESGDSAYFKFKEVLKKLKDPKTRSSTRRFLSEIESHTSNETADGTAMEKYHFQIHKLTLRTNHDLQELYGKKLQTLTLLEMSSIFLPEDWSFTFYEGLSRHPDSGFRDRDVTELGCGNGWISIALADQCAPRKIYGLDINPRAIKVAEINLFLNALSDDGEVILDSEGKSLLDRVEFHVSDLLQFLREKHVFLDRVIGCIPQVLNPDPKETLRIVQESMSEDFLYSLSNYCGLQGQIEDQFGLGLVARAVEESIEVLKPSGKLILNLGGRPGKKVLERMLQRRGFSIHPLWQTRVTQAVDTEILPLVEIELNSFHRFEFFLGSGTEESVSARTAFLLQQRELSSDQPGYSNFSVGHNLTVYEASLIQPNQVKAIFRFLSRYGSDETRGSLDLFFLDQSCADEKISFLGYLARALESNPHFSFPKELPEGKLSFRKQISKFLRLYFRVPFAEENVVIIPSRQVAVNSLIYLYNAKLAIVDGFLIKYVPREFVSALPPCDHPVVLEAPRRSDLLIQLTETLKPDLLIVSLADFEMRTMLAFERLLEATKKSNSRIFLDISDFLELSSSPASNGALQFLSEKQLPENAAILCGLVKNQVYFDMEVCFVLSENATFLRQLAHCAVEPYSPTPTLPQLYYGAIVEELTGFQMPFKDQEMEQRALVAEESSTSNFKSPRVCHPLPPSYPSSPLLPLVHLETSENLLDSPAALRRFLFEAFARQNLTEPEMDASPEVAQVLSQRLGLSKKTAFEVAFSYGTGPIMNSLMSSCFKTQGALICPSGISICVKKTAEMSRVLVSDLTTLPEHGFKVDPTTIESAMLKTHNHWMVLSAPVANPYGSVYSLAELASIFDKCRELDISLILDLSFLGLSPPALTENAADSELTLDGLRIVIIGDVAHEFSCGGLGFAFAATPSPSLANSVRELSNQGKPHGTVRYTAKKLLGMLIQSDSALLSDMASRMAVLSTRAQKMAEVLSGSGWDVLPGHTGDLSLLARPKSFFGEAMDFNSSETIVLSPENVATVLKGVFGLLVNAFDGSGLAEYFSFNLTLPEEAFSEALKRIELFYGRVSK